MKYKRNLFGCLIVVLLINSSLIAQTTIVQGKLLGSNGKPMLKADISYSTPFEKTAKYTVTVEKDGSYSFTISSLGVTHLNFAGLDHITTQIPIINDQNQNIELNVNLGGYSYLDSFDDVKIIGDFNNFDFNSSKPMTKQTDGTYTFSMNWDKPLFKYQLLNVESSKRSINGTQSEDYEYDGGGDYRSIVSTQNGVAKIIFDPQKLPIITQKSVFEFKDSKNKSAVLNKYSKLTNDYFEVYFKQYKEYQNSGKDPKNFKFTDGDMEKEIKNKVIEENDQLARQIGMSFYITLPRTSKIDIDSLEIVDFFNSLDPNSFLWEANPNLFNYSYSYLGKDNSEKLLEKIFEQTKNNSVRFRLLTQKYYNARYKKDESKLKELYKMVSDEFGETEPGKSFLKRFNIVVKIKEGADIPDFSVKSFDDSTKIFSKSNMLGKIYLIDFWATWCGPCVGEMPNLHEVYEKYKSKGFEILSFSLDNGTKEIKTFREKKFKMPWLNAYLGPDWNQPLVKSFEVEGIPKPLLIGKDGKILATEKDLRGDKLDKTLSNYFK